MSKLTTLAIRKLKKITLLCTLPVLRLDDKNNNKKRYFGEINESFGGVYDLGIIKSTNCRNENIGISGSFNEKINGVISYKNEKLGLTSDKTPTILHKSNNYFNSEIFSDNSPVFSESFYINSINDLLSGDFTGYNYLWFGILNTDGQLDPTILSLVYLNILAILLFTLLFIEYPLVPILFIMELIMFIPVLLLYLFASESTFVFLIYIINAVTVEAVSAVGIAMLYLMGWKFKDTVNPDALESNFFFVFSFISNLSNIKKNPNKIYSWYYQKTISLFSFWINFIFYFINRSVLFIYISIFLLFIIFTFFIKVNFDVILLDRLMPLLFHVPNNIIFENVNKNVVYFEKINKLNNNLIYFFLQKNQTNKYSDLMSEFFFSKNIIYNQFLHNNSIFFSSLENSNYTDYLYFEENFNIFNKFKEFNYLRSSNYLDLDMLYYSTKNNPINVLFLLNHLFISTQSTANLDNFGNKLNNYKIINNFYNFNDKTVTYNNKKKISNSKLGIFDYQVNQLKLLLLLKPESPGFDVNYINRFRINDNLMSNFEFFKNKNKKNIFSLDVEKSTNSIKKINNYVLSQNSLNISKFINWNLKNLNYLDLFSNYKKQENNNFSIKFLYNSNSVDINNSFYEELSYLNFIKLPKFSTIWFISFYNNFKNKNYLNNYFKSDKKINIIITKPVTFYDKNYKFFFKNNINYLIGFKNSYGFVSSSKIGDQFDWYSIRVGGLIRIKKFLNFKKKYISFSNKIRKVKKYFFFTIFDLSLNNKYNRYDNIFYSKQKSTYNWSDKSPSSVVSPLSKTLPWFESYDSDLEVYDLSSLGMFNDSVYLSEILKLDLKKKLNFFNHYVGLKNNDNHYSEFEIFYEFYIKKNGMFLNCKVNGTENTKKLMTNIVLDYNFNSYGDKISRKVYTSLLSKYYENIVYLKRLKKINLEFPSSSNRLLGLVFSDNVDIMKGQLFSEQSKEFGLVSADFLYENYKRIGIPKIILQNWYVFGKVNGLFSYKKPKTISSDYLKDLKLIGSNFFIKNYNFNSFVNFQKEIGYWFSINKEIGSGSFDFKKTFKNFSNSDYDLYLNGVGDGYKNIENMNKNLDYYDSSHKIKLFNLPKKNYLDFGINYFSKKNKNYSNKSIIDKRFLLTFKKKLKIREKFLETNIYRINRSVINKNLVNRLVGGVGNFKLKKINEDSSINFTVDNLSKISFNGLKNIDKITIVNDGEIFEKSSRSNINKPHTLYGYLWDEYLRQTYGFGINFIDFNSKIKIAENKQNKTYSLNSNNFQNNFENNLKPNNEIIGLSRDREIANSITGKLLSKTGFIKEINNILVNNIPKKTDVIKYLEDVEPNSGGFLDYQKKNLFSDTILREKLLKKSINNIMKYSENPIGFKHTHTQIGLKLPYLKRKFIIKNENDFESNVIGLKSYSWLDSKNNINDQTNRIGLISQVGDNNFFGSPTSNIWTNWQEDLYNDSMLSDVLDYEFNDNLSSVDGIPQLDFNQSSLFYNDFDQDSILTTKMFLKSKRSLNSQKIINKKIEKIFKINNLVSAFSNIEKNQIKKKKNIRLFKKLEIYGNSVLGSLDVEKYKNNLGFEKNVFLVDLVNNRRNLNFSDYHIFKNPIVEHIRNGNILLKNKNLSNLKKTKKRKDIISNLFFDVENKEFLKLYLDEYPNFVLLENSISGIRSQNTSKASIVKVPNYINNQYFNHFENISIFFKENFDDFEINLTGSFDKKRIFYIDKHEDYFYGSFLKKFLKFDIKYSKMGLASLSTSPFSKYENYFSNFVVKSNILYKKYGKYKEFYLYEKNLNIILGYQMIPFSYFFNLKNIKIEKNNILNFNLLGFVHNLINFHKLYYLYKKLNISKYKIEILEFLVSIEQKNLKKINVTRSKDKFLSGKYCFFFKSNFLISILPVFDLLTFILIKVVDGFLSIFKILKK